MDQATRCSRAERRQLRSPREQPHGPRSVALHEPQACVLEGSAGERGEADARDGKQRGVRGRSAPPPRRRG